MKVSNREFQVIARLRLTSSYDKERAQTQTELETPPRERIRSLKGEQRHRTEVRQVIERLLRKQLIEKTQVTRQGHTTFAYCPHCQKIQYFTSDHDDTAYYLTEQGQKQEAPPPPRKPLYIPRGPYGKRPESSQRHYTREHGRLRRYGPRPKRRKTDRYETSRSNFFEKYELRERGLPPRGLWEEAEEAEELLVEEEEGEEEEEEEE